MNTLVTYNEAIETLSVSSPAFEHRNYIPKKYAGDGDGINPPLTVNNIPPGTKSLAIIFDEHHTPIREWVHWLVWNIKPTARIKENSIPGIEGMNDFRIQKYKGPFPQEGVHYYSFRLYALDTLLDLHPRSTKYDIEKAMSTHILAIGELVGLYKRGVYEI